jgi:cell wall assembly regulator SMI1
MKERKHHQPKEIGLLIEIIKGSPRNLLFPPASDLEIAQVERQLGAVLPVSYKKSLLAFNGGILYQTDELFGTSDHPQFDLQSVVTMKQRMDYAPASLIPFYHSGGFYFFDLSRKNLGEYPIVSWNRDSQRVADVAESFSEWLEQIIEDNEVPSF